jgi:N utilization substance protein A
MTPEQLEAIEGIGPKTVEKISLAVNNYFSSLEGGEMAAVEGELAAESAEAQETSPEGSLEEVAAEDPAADETAEFEAVSEEAKPAKSTEEPAEEPAPSESKE